MFKKLYWIVVILLTMRVFAAGVAFALPAENIELINNRDYFKSVYNLIKTAQTSIKVVMFSAIYYDKHPNSYSNKLIDALIKVKKKGVIVEVILETDALEKNSSKIKDVKKRFKKAGIPVYNEGKGTTHCKLLIIDAMYTVIGSTNWSYSALTKNNESSVVIKSPEVALAYTAYFDKIKK